MREHLTSKVVMVNSYTIGTDVLTIDHFSRERVNAELGGVAVESNMLVTFQSPTLSVPTTILGQVVRCTFELSD